MRAEDGQVKEYGVMVRCFTFNQSSYIEQALSSFVTQRTDFPFIIALVDDSSTDRQVCVIKDFLFKEFDTVEDQIETDYAIECFARHKQNVNCYIVVLFLKYNHHSAHKPKMPYLAKWSKVSKYQAICEGDDYWIDNNKLQIQYDYLESHPKHSMCFSAYQSLFPNGRVTKTHRYQADNDLCSIRHCIRLGGSYARVNTLLFRPELLSPTPIWRKYAKVGDIPLFLTLFTRGRVGYIDREMACYRVNSEGSWSNQQKERTIRELLCGYRQNYLFWKFVNKGTNYKYFDLIVYRYLVNALRLVKNLYHFVQ